MDYYLEYVYDSNGNRTSYARYEDDGLQYWVEYVYNEDNKEIRNALYNDDGSLINYKTTEYDEYGHQTVSIQYNPDGSIERKSNYLITYDVNGNELYTKFLWDGLISGEWYYTPTEIWERELD